MKEILLAFLVALGFEEDVIEAVKSGDEKKIAELKADDLVKEAIERQKEILAADEDFVKPIKDEAIIGSLKSRESFILKEYKDLLSQEEFDKLPKDKRLDEAIKVIVKKLKAKQASGDPDSKKAIEELNAKIEELEAAKAKIEEEKEAEIQRVKEESEGKISSYERNRVLMAEYQKTLGGKLIVDDEDTAEMILKKVEKQFDVKVESGKVVLYEKGKATKATKNSKPVAFDALLTETAEPFIRKQDKVDPKRATHTVLKDDDDTKPKVFRPGADIMKQEIEKRKAAAAAK